MLLIKVRYRAGLWAVEPRPTSHYGKPQNRENLRGLPPGGLVGLDGISSVL